MPLNITVHSELTPRYGVAAEAPIIDSSTPAQAVALGAQSTVINGPALLCLIADEGQRISVTQTPGYAAPLASGVKLLAGLERWYRIRAGAWYINAVAG